MGASARRPGDGPTERRHERDADDPAKTRSGVNDKRTDVETGERKRFASAILPAWARKSPQVAEVLPLLYLHGLSSGDFARSHCGLRSINMRVTVVTVAASEAATVLAL